MADPNLPRRGLRPVTPPTEPTPTTQPGGVSPLVPNVSNTTPGSAGSLRAPAASKDESSFLGRKAEGFLKRTTLGQGLRLIPGAYERVSMEAKRVGELVQAAPSGAARFFGGLAVDATKGLGQQMVYNLSYGNIGSEYKPRTAEEAVQSFVNTAKVWERVPAYVERWNAGEPISDMVVEDAGNLFFIGKILKGASKGIQTGASTRAAGFDEAAATAATAQEAAKAATRAARNAKVANRAQKVADFSDRVVYYSDRIGELPFRPYVYAGKGLGKAIRNGVYVEGLAGFGAEGAKGYIKQIDDLRRAEPDIDPNDPRLTDLQRKAVRNLRMSLSYRTRQQIKEAVRNAEHEEKSVTRSMLDIKRNPLLKDEINPATGEVWGELAPYEEQAIIAVLNGRAGLIRGLAQRLNMDPEVLAELGKYDETPEYWLTPEGARLAVDFLENRVTPEHYDRLSNAIENLARQIVVNTQQAVEGYGRKNPLAPDYLLPLPFINKLKQAVMASKNGQLIELWLALEEAGLLIPLQQAMDMGFDEAQLRLREEAMLGFVRNLPDELALDPTMYPANMRENIEFYRRIRRSFNQRAMADAEGKPIPPVDGGPRAPEDPWYPFRDDPDLADLAPAGPEQFPMPRGKGKLSAATNKAKEMKAKADKIGAELVKVADKIADLEEKLAKLVERSRKYKMMDDYLAGMNVLAIARKYKISAFEVNNIISRSPLGRAIDNEKSARAILERTTEDIGKRRAALTPEQFEAERAKLEEEYRKAEKEARQAAMALNAARNINEIARAADESAADRLMEEIAAQEDILADGEKLYEDFGGDLDDVRTYVDPRDPEIGPVVPEFVDEQLNQMIETVQQAVDNSPNSPLAEPVTRVMATINAAWSQITDFNEAVTSDAELRVAELRLQQLGEVIADLSDRITETMIVPALEGATTELLVMQAVLEFVQNKTNADIIAGVAPLTTRVVGGGDGPSGRGIPYIPEGADVFRLPYDLLPHFDDVPAILEDNINYTNRGYKPIIYRKETSSGPLAVRITEGLYGGIEVDIDVGTNRDSVGLGLVFESETPVDAAVLRRFVEEITASEEVGALARPGFLEEADFINVSDSLAPEVRQEIFDALDDLFDPRRKGSTSPTETRLQPVPEPEPAQRGSQPLADPELEAIANQMADDPAMLDEMFDDVENYRLATQMVDEARNPTPEMLATRAEQLRQRDIDLANQDLDNAVRMGQSLGGKQDLNKPSLVTFYITPDKKGGEWDWWYNGLDPRTRSRLGRTYFRPNRITSGAAKGPRIVSVADGIDSIAEYDPIAGPMTPDEWGQAFLEYVKMRETALRRLRELKRKYSPEEAAAALTDDPDYIQAVDEIDRLEEAGVDPAFIEAFDRARYLADERAAAAIPDDPSQVRVDPNIADPTVRAAAYEADYLESISKKATLAMKRAETAQQRFKAFQQYLKDYDRYTGARAETARLRGIPAKVSEQIIKTEQRLSKLRDKERQLRNEKRKANVIAGRLARSESFDTATTGMPGAVPLEIALEGGYPAEQFSVDVGLADGGLEPVTLRGPMYVPTGRPRPFTGGLATEVLEAGLPGFNKLTSEHFRDGDRQTIFSIRLLADRMGREARAMSENESYRAIVATFGETAADLLGQDESLALYQKAYDIVSNMSESSRLAFAREAIDEEGGRRIDGIGAYASGVPDPKAVFNIALREQYGRLVAEEMAFRGYTVVDPYNRITAVVPFDKITHETMFLPKGLREMIAKREGILDPSTFNVAMRSMHKVNSAFKTTTLVLSVMWQLGDLVSSIIIAQMTGVDVRTMLQQIRSVLREEYGTGWEGFKTMVDPRRELPTPTPRVRIAQESPIQDIGFSQAERSYLRGIPDVERVPLLTRLTGRQYPELVRGRNIAKVSFKINETLNRISRHAYFLELLERRLQEIGRTIDDVAADGSWRNDPEIKKLVFEVANTANDWLGDFADLSMFERKYITLAFPFYAWTKHIHKVFAMLGDQHPQSLRWYIYIGTLNYDPNEDPMRLRYGNPLFMGGTVSLNPFNPLADVMAGPIAQFATEGNPQPLAQTLGPIPRFLGAAAGLDVTRLRPLQRPPGSASYSESGVEQPQSLLTPGQWDEALGFGLMQFPIAQRVLNVLPGERLPGTQIALGPVTRYQTGEARLKPGTTRRIERWGGRPAALGRLFSLPGIPYQSEEQLGEIEKAARARLRTIEKMKERRERYLRSLED